MLKPESVWDYPRPPALQPVAETVRVLVDGLELANTVGAMRILETSHPPVYYIPPDDVVMTRLARAPGSSFCEWKGRAVYWTYQTPDCVVESIAWSYPKINRQYAAIEGFLAFYPSKAGECWVDDERVTSQPGDFYGGWITSNLEGPFKGGPGSLGW